MPQPSAIWPFKAAEPQPAPSAPLPHAGQRMTAEMIATFNSRFGAFDLRAQQEQIAAIASELYAEFWRRDPAETVDWDWWLTPRTTDDRSKA